MKNAFDAYTDIDCPSAHLCRGLVCPLTRSVETTFNNGPKTKQAQIEQTYEKHQD